MVDMQQEVLQQHPPHHPQEGAHQREALRLRSLPQEVSKLSTIYFNYFIRVSMLGGSLKNLSLII